MDRRKVVQSILVAGGVLGSACATTAQNRVGQGLVSASDQRIRQRYVDTDYGQAYCWTAGAGPNVVLIHQSGNSSEEFAGLVPLLADRFRLISLDLPGHGRSDDPADEPSVDDYTIAIEQVLAKLDVGKTHVVGHHGGALAAMNFTVRNRDQVGKTILSGTGAARSPAENGDFLASLLKQDRRIGDDEAWAAEAWGNYLGYLSDGATEADILKPFMAYLDGLLRPWRGVVVNLKWDRRPAVHQMRGPVLLLQGTRDSFVSGQETLLDIIPGSERQVLEGCGTFMFYDRPDICAEVISDYLLPGVA